MCNRIDSQGGEGLIFKSDGRHVFKMYESADILEHRASEISQPTTSDERPATNHDQEPPEQSFKMVQNKTIQEFRLRGPPGANVSRASGTRLVVPSSDLHTWRPRGIGGYRPRDKGIGGLHLEDGA